MEVNPDDKLKTSWNSFADVYEQYIQHITLSLYKLAVPLLKLSTATTIADTGCGPGHSSRYLRSLVPPSVKILSNDISEAMVSKTSSLNIENTEVIVASNESLPYPDGICNKYIANLSLHLVNDPKKMLQEAIRVLQPGGEALITVIGKKEDSGFLVIMGKSVVRAGIVSTEKSPFYLNSQTELNQMLVDAGFSQVRSFYTSVGVNFSSFEEFFAMNEGVLRVLNYGYEEKASEIRSNMQEEYEKVINSGKIITFDALVVYGVKP